MRKDIGFLRGFINFIYYLLPLSFEKKRYIEIGIKNQYLWNQLAFEISIERHKSHHQLLVFRNGISGKSP